MGAHTALAYSIDCVRASDFVRSILRSLIHFVRRSVFLQIFQNHHLTRAPLFLPKHILSHSTCLLTPLTLHLFTLLVWWMCIFLLRSHASGLDFILFHFISFPFFSLAFASILQSLFFSYTFHLYVFFITITAVVVRSVMPLLIRMNVTYMVECSRWI